MDTNASTRLVLLLLLLSIGKWSIGYWSSWTFANAEIIGNWSLDFALEYQVYTSYVGE